MAQAGSFVLADVGNYVATCSYGSYRHYTAKPGGLGSNRLDELDGSARDRVAAALGNLNGCLAR